MITWYLGTCAPENYCSEFNWCHRSELGLAEVPDDIPPEVVGLYLNDNKLVSLATNQFANFTSLTFLSLSWNLIQQIQPGAFTGLVQLEDLTLFQNLLTSLEVNMFIGMPALKNLVLSNNAVSKINKGAFNGLENLEKLYLYDNDLTVLKTNMFSELTSLLELTLTFNEISVMEPGAYMGLGNLQKLWLDNNHVLRHLHKHMFQVRGLCF